MTTPAGTITMNQINAEVGYAANTTLSFSNSRFRGLAEDYANPISISSARGKTWPPAFTRYNTVGDTAVSIPAGRTRVRAKIWGPGGGGGGGAQVTGGAGGSGAFIECELSVAGYSTLNVVIGGGGGGGNQAGSGGGAGAGAGGGWSGLYLAGVAWLAVAGAGGGGGGSGQNAGDNGGPGGAAGIVNGTASAGIGGNLGAYTPGGGGTQTTGGAAGSASAVAGSFQAGGKGHAGDTTNPISNPGGGVGYPSGGAGGSGESGGGGGAGGGAGWYGGGGGDWQAGQGGSGGGGGSSYVNSSYVTQAINYIAGNMNASGRLAVAAPNAGDAQYTADGSIAGRGGQGGASTISGLAGGRGLVALAFY